MRAVIRTDIAVQDVVTMRPSTDLRSIILRLGCKSEISIEAAVLRRALEILRLAAGEEQSLDGEPAVVSSPSEAPE